MCVWWWRQRRVRVVHKQVRRVSGDGYQGAQADGQRANVKHGGGFCGGGARKVESQQAVRRCSVSRRDATTTTTTITTTTGDGRTRTCVVGDGASAAATGCTATAGAPA